mgnify:CR=1 FL=1
MLELLYSCGARISEVTALDVDDLDTEHRAVVLRGKGGRASSPLCVVGAGARQGVTHVTRGRDLFAATDVHRLLQVVLGLPEPLYHHHGLLTDRHGNKLSKSAGAPSLRSRREAGATAAQVRTEIECGRSATRRAD